MHSDWSESTRAAWNEGFIPTVNLDPDIVPVVLGAAAFSLWSDFPGIVYLHGQREAGKTTLLNHVGDLLDDGLPRIPIADFSGSTLNGLLRGKIMLVDDVPPASGTAATKLQLKLSELARAVSNRGARVVSSGEVDYSPPIMFVAGELPPPRGAVEHRMLTVELSRVSRTSVVAASKSHNTIARRVFGGRFRAWLAALDVVALSDEFAEFAPEVDSRQLVAVAFGVELLNRFLSEHAAAPLVLDLSALGERNVDGSLPPLIRELAAAVVEAVGAERYRLDGGRESDAPLLGRVDGTRVFLLPAVTMPLIAPLMESTASVAAALERYGLLNRGEGGRTTACRIDGKVRRVWEIDGLFEDKDLAILRGDQGVD